MSESFIRTPDDSANAGPKQRTYTYAAGTNTVHVRPMGLVDEAGNKLVLYTADPAAGAVAIPVRQVTGSPFAVTGPLTRAQLDAATVGVTVANFPASFAVNNFPASFSVSNFPASQNVVLTGATGALSVVGPLTNAELRAAAVPVSGTFWQATQPVSLAANTPDVTDRAGRLLGVTTISAGTVSATITNAFALDATLTGGTAKFINRGGAKGTTAAADVTSTASGANHQPLDVAVYDAAGNLIDPRSVRALTIADVVTVGSGTVSATVANFPATQAVSLADNAARLLGVITDKTANLMGFSGTSGATAGNLTIPAPGTAGVSIYLEYLEVTLYSTAARVGAAAPVTVTVSNLPGNPSLTFTSAGAIGTNERQLISASHPIRSATANATIVLGFPAVTGALWRVNAFYWQA